MATKWGNYFNYNGPSKFSSAATHVPDSRLAILNDLVPGLFTAKSCLDIGCNAGTVSCEIALDFGAASVTGVDIDQNLVQQANKLLALRSSRVRPSTQHADAVVDYFPISAVLSHGYRIEPATTSSPSSHWPRVNFVAADWIATTDRDSNGPYHVILALSVIKWIHLEHRDQGLLLFFHKCATSLQSGGYLVIELQTWDSYEKAVRPNTAPHFLPNFLTLEYRPETSFDDLLAKEGFTLCASSTALVRRLNVYRKS